jgi:hypothetical protein
LATKRSRWPSLVVVDEGAACVPADLWAWLDEAGGLGDVGEGAVAIVAVERVLAVVGDEEIVEAVVVVVADAAGLAPAGFVFEAGADRYIGKGAVAIVFEEMAMRLLALGESFEAPAVDEKEIEPAIVVVVVEGEAAAGGLKQILVLLIRRRRWSCLLRPDSAATSIKFTPSGVPSMGDLGPGGGGAGLAS